MDNNLSLYVWEDVLVDYTPGIAFALAGSVDEARQMLYDQIGIETYGLVYDLEKPPIIATTPTAFHCTGGS